MQRAHLNFPRVHRFGSLNLRQKLWRVCQVPEKTSTCIIDASNSEVAHQFFYITNFQKAHTNISFLHTCFRYITYALRKKYCFNLNLIAVSLNTPQPFSAESKWKFIKNTMKYLPFIKILFTTFTSKTCCTRM